MHVAMTQARRDEFQEIVDLWETSVRATHDFTTEADTAFFRPLIRDAYLDAVQLFCAKDTGGRILGFAGAAESKIGMLFVSPDHFRPRNRQGASLSTLAEMVGLNWLHAIALSGVKLRVRTRDAEQALGILEELKSPE